MSVTARSVTSAARRAQVLEATIAVIADEGLAQASFSRIAERAELSSTRLISYHFAGRAELVAALVEHVVTAMGDEVGASVRAETTAAGRLRAYIEGVVHFADTRRAEMSALMQVALSSAWSSASASTTTGATTGSSTGAGPAPSGTAHLEQILLDGQRSGELRDFDVRVMAQTVQRAVEGVPFQLAAEPDLDCRAHAAELVDLFDRATRAEP